MTRRRIRWLQLAAWCECGRRVAEWIPATERGRYADVGVRRTRCRARGCGRVVEITAGAYQEADGTVDRQRAAS